MLLSQGYDVFGVENGTECYTSAEAAQTYGMYGQSDDCFGGKGGNWSMNVYKVEPTGTSNIN